MDDQASRKDNTTGNKSNNAPKNKNNPQPRIRKSSLNLTHSRPVEKVNLDPDNQSSDDADDWQTMPLTRQHRIVKDPQIVLNNQNNIAMSQNFETNLSNTQPPSWQRMPSRSSKRRRTSDSPPNTNILSTSNRFDALPLDSDSQTEPVIKSYKPPPNSLVWHRGRK